MIAERTEITLWSVVVSAWTYFIQRDEALSPSRGALAVKIMNFWKASREMCSTFGKDNFCTFIEYEVPTVLSLLSQSIDSIRFIEECSQFNYICSSLVFGFFYSYEYIFIAFALINLIERTLAKALHVHENKFWMGSCFKYSEGYPIHFSKIEAFVKLVHGMYDWNPQFQILTAITKSCKLNNFCCHCQLSQNKYHVFYYTIPKMPDQNTFYSILIGYSIAENARMLMLAREQKMKQKIKG